MGTTDTVNHTIDSLLNDWSKIVYLYHLVHDFAEQFKSGWCFTNIFQFFRYIYVPKCLIRNCVSLFLFSLKSDCIFRSEFTEFYLNQIIFVYKSSDWLWIK